MLRAATLSVLLTLALAVPAATVGSPAPGAPGDKAVWTEADKDGFGTATSLQSQTWLTLDDGRLTEVYYPDLGTPALRDLQLVVSDGRTFTEREQDSTEQRVRLLDSKSLSYRQVNTDRDGLYRIVKTYTTDPARSSVLVNVEFRALTRRPLDLYVLHDPALSNNGDDDSGASRAGGLVAWDASAASALLTDARFRRTSSGFLGRSDGWTDLAADHRMNRRHEIARNGNVVQTARTNLNGKRRQEMTLALGFGADRRAAIDTARASLARGFDSSARAYDRGWHDYIDGLKPRPASARPYGPAYWVSAMVLAASEDKVNRGASIASPSMPWAWGLLTIEEPSAAYHLVWPRDL
jgi:glucoamylase